MAGCASKDDNDKATLYDILQSPVLDVLSQHLDIADIVNLTRTCRYLSDFYHDMKSRKWNVDSSLRRFVNQPTQFREQVGLAEALIAGGFPQEFFERGSFQAESLDLVTTAVGAATLIAYLEAREGYVKTGVTDLPTRPLYCPYRHIEKAVHLHRITGLPKQGQGECDATATTMTSKSCIRIFTISGFSFPMRGVLEGSWHTASVSFMSWRSAFCVFPALTFIARTSFLLSKPDFRHGTDISQLVARGYRFEASTSAYSIDGESGHSLQKCRKIGDRFCWKIDFATVDGCALPLVVDGEKLDPVKAEDVIYISENKDEMNSANAALLAACGLWSDADKCATHAHHYDAKLMRWSKIYC